MAAVALAYAYVRGYAMVGADPIGPPAARARVVDEFLSHCREQGWGVAFLSVREADAPLYRERGMHAIYKRGLHCQADTAGSIKGMKLSVSLAEEDVAFLDAYARAHAIPSRSAAVHQAIRALRLRDLDAAYGAAFSEWSAGDDAELWDATAGDGL